MNEKALLVKAIHSEEVRQADSRRGEAYASSMSDGQLAERIAELEQQVGPASVTRLEQMTIEELRAEAQRYGVES